MKTIFKAYDIRGTYPEQINEEIAEKIGRAFVSFLNPKKVVIGRDMRLHSQSLFDVLVKGITEQGADVIDIGMCSTPISYFANGFLKADASIMITASHNNKRWNGFKLCRANTVPVSSANGIKDIERIVQNCSWGKYNGISGKVSHIDMTRKYGNHIKSFSRLDRKLKVVTDFANSVGSIEIAGIRDLFDIIPMYEELDGSLPNHEANPLVTETLDALCRKVKETGADFGAGFDGDADRCGFVDEKGNIIPMDLITALIAKDILSSGPATILYDLRSSKVVKESIESNGGKALMCRVGHAFIKTQMRETGAVFAGELSGHYYFKENYTAESQALAFLLLANLICKSGKKLSELVAPLKKYFASGEINSHVSNMPFLINKIKSVYKDGKVFELDGVTVEYPDWWFNMRGSNTELLVRLNVEADTKEKMIQKRDELLSLIRE